MIYTPELNFLTEFTLSRNGMITELKAEFDIIRLAFTQVQELGPDYQDMIERILVMPLRKLLFEKQHLPLILRLCPDFKMPLLKGIPFDGDDKLHIELAPYEFGNINSWIPLEQWGQQKIAYYNKTASDLPDAIPLNTFQSIINKLKNGDKNTFQSLFDQTTITYDNESIDVYIRKNCNDSKANMRIFELMKKAGYYDLTIFDFIKHLSDKRGAHIDPGIAPLIKIINGDKNRKITPIVSFAIQLIYATKKQIPEMQDYWSDMDGIIENA